MYTIYPKKFFYLYGIKTTTIFNTAQTFTRLIESFPSFLDHCHRGDTPSWTVDYLVPPPSV